MSFRGLRSSVLSVPVLSRLVFCRQCRCICIEFCMLTTICQQFAHHLAFRHLELRLQLLYLRCMSRLYQCILVSLLLLV